MFGQKDHVAHADLAEPDLRRLVVLGVHGDPQPLGRQPQHPVPPRLLVLRQVLERGSRDDQGQCEHAQAARLGGVRRQRRQLLADLFERRRIGVVFQEDASFPWLTVWDNAAFGLRRAGHEALHAALPRRAGALAGDRAGLGILRRHARRLGIARHCDALDARQALRGGGGSRRFRAHTSRPGTVAAPYT